MSQQWEKAIWQKASEEFNQGAFFECHETLEHWWLYADEPLKMFLQGIIQIAAAHIKLRENNFKGAYQLLKRALPKIITAQEQELFKHCPIERSRLADFQGKIMFTFSYLEKQTPEKIVEKFPQIDF